MLGVDPLTFLSDGGFFMAPIALCGFVAMIIACERLYAVAFRLSADTDTLLAHVVGDVGKGDVDGAIARVAVVEGSVVGDVLAAGLSSADAPRDELEAALDEARFAATPLVGRRVGYLPMLANVSTLLGLVGTIQGLILAFDAVSKASADAKSAALAQGIAVAMYTTMFGLMVAIPTLVVHGVVAQRANALLDDADRAAVALLRALAARARRRGA